MVKIYLNLSLSGVVTCYLPLTWVYFPINGVCDYTHVPIALWGFLQLKSELIRKAETQKIRENRLIWLYF